MQKLTLVCLLVLSLFHFASPGLTKSATPKLNVDAIIASLAAADRVEPTCRADGLGCEYTHECCGFCNDGVCEHGD